VASCLNTTVLKTSPRKRAFFVSANVEFLDQGLLLFFLSRGLPLTDLGDKIMEWKIEVEGVGEIGSVTAESKDAAREAAIHEFGAEGYRELGDLNEVIYWVDAWLIRLKA
jgi:hypothetical protein